MATTRSRTRPSGGATRQETIDVIRREATDVADTEFAQPEGSSGPSLREIDPQIFFGTRNSGMQVGVNHGSITIAPSQTNVRVSQTIFGNLAIQDEQRTEFNSTRNILRKKARLQTGRRHQKAISNHSYYEPYAVVKNRNVKQRLIHLAGRFTFLDCGFAEYFQSIIPSFDRDYVQQRLQEIRDGIAKGQNSNPANVVDPEKVYVGDLGEFCEAVSRAWNDASILADSENRKFIPTHRRDQEIFEYLQDAFETSYWELMLDIFLQWRQITKSLSGDIVLKVLDSLEREIKIGRSELLAEIETQSEDLLEELAPILDGIDARIAILSTVGDLNELPPLEMTEPTTLQSPCDSPGDPGEVLEVLQREKENVGLIAMILIFLIAAIVPGYKAFSISMESTTPGSVHDADFWYLIQSSIMSVLGNLTMVVPLLKKSWFSPAYSTMWIFFSLGVTFAIASIIIYPLLNTGWSSMLAFFGSVASAASVLIMTQAAARNVPRKMKDD